MFSANYQILYSAARQIREQSAYQTSLKMKSFKSIISKINNERRFFLTYIKYSISIWAQRQITPGTLPPSIFTSN